MKRIGAVLGFLALFAASLRADTFETRYYNGNMSPANEVGPIAGNNSSGQATITVVVRRDDGGNIVAGTVHFDIDYNFPAPVVVRGLHIHEGGAGVNGPIRIDTGITPSATVAAQGAGNLFRTVEVTGGAALTALSGLLANPAGFYVNLHTTEHTGGLMRDQLQVAAQPNPVVFDNGVVNNASFAAGTNPVAPGSIAAVFGKYLNSGPAALFTGFDNNGRLLRALGGTQVTVNGIAAPIFYSTFGQLGIQIPVELAGQTSATLQVSVGGKTSVSRTIPLAGAAPGLFAANQAGTGPAAALHEDGVTPVTASNPALPNEVVVLFGTGLGATSTPLETGAPSTGNPVAAPPAVTIDGVAVTPEFAGRAPTFVGLDQVNVRLPASTRAASDLPVYLTSGARQSNTVTLATGTGGSTTNNPVPAISSLAPSSAYVGDPAFTLTIHGTGFTPASTVLIDNAPRTSVFVSETMMTVQMTAADCSSQRSLSIRVQNPAPGGGTSGAIVFPILPAPGQNPYDDY